jgi:hypothetical protein
MIDWNHHPFAGDSLIGKRIEMYRDAYHISWCIETGTQLGYTARVLANMFIHVATIEINKEYFDGAKELLGEHKNADLILGESDKELPALLSSSIFSPSKSILFYLDAHGFGHDCPILRELAVIAKHRASRRDVVVIHDFAVPDRPELGCDGSGSGSLNLELVKDSIGLVFPSGWTVRFNDVAQGSKRGCAFFTSL